MAKRKSVPTVAPSASTFASQSPEARKLALDKLASSGLDEQDAICLGMSALEAQTTKLIGPNFAFVPSLKIPYWDPRGEPLAAAPAWPQFFRVRYLMVPALKGDEKKPAKYMQEGGAGVCAYFPRLPTIDWPAIFDDPRETVIITEGELKAAKACKEGFATIGLGGVNSYRGRSLGHNLLLPELKAINWVKRRVHIIFDSDVTDNPNVVMALNDLGQTLCRLGALPHFVHLAPLEGGADKTGLDDFLVARPAERLVDLLRSSAEPITSAEDLFALNEKVVFIDNPGIVVALDGMNIMQTRAFHESRYSTEQYEEKVLTPGGKVSYQKVGLTKAWISWPLRHNRARLTYKPGDETLLDAVEAVPATDRAPGTPAQPAMVNTWPGWGVEPKKGSVKPFLKLIDHLFTGAEPGAKDWFLRWCAYPLKYPGTKLFTAAILYGIHHGTGKSQVGYSLGAIYGHNFSEIKQDDLHGSFNAWAKERQFILADDITGSNKREDADVMKKMITQKSLRVNAKYVPEYELPDCLNYLFTSNSIDALYLEDSDRRYFVHEVKATPLDEDFYIEYESWLRFEGGAAALFHYLVNLPDIDLFNPAAPAMGTKAKARMTMDGLSDLGAWVRQLRDAPETVLKLGQAALPADLYSNKELVQVFDLNGTTRITAAGMGRELTRAGFAQVNDGAPVVTPTLRDRFYITRNREHWEKATMVQVREHLNKHKSGK